MDILQHEITFETESANSHGVMVKKSNAFHSLTNKPAGPEGNPQHS